MQIRFNRNLMPFYIFSLIGLIIPIILGIILYIQTLNLTRATFLDETRNAVEQSLANMEKLYEEIEFLVLKAQLSDDIKMIEKSRGIDLREEMPNLISINEKTVFFETSFLKQFVKTFFLIFPASEIAIGESSLGSLKNFYRFDYTPSDLDYEAFRIFLRNDYDKQIIGESFINRANDQMISDKIILHSVKFQKDERGQLLIVMNDLELKQQLRTIDLSYGGLIVLRDVKNDVLSAISTYNHTFPYDFADGDYDELPEHLLSNKKLHKMEIRSEHGNLYCQVYLSPLNYSVQSRYIMVSTIIVTLSLLLINMIVILIFLSQTTNPLLTIFQAFQNDSSSDSNGPNGYSFIGEKVQNIVNKSISLEKEIEKQKPIINSLILESLLTELRMDEQELTDLFKTSGISLNTRYQSCFVLVFNPMDYRLTEDIYSEYMVKKVIVEELFNRRISGNTYFLYQGTERLVVFHGGDGESKELYYNQLTGEIKEAVKELDSQLDMNIITGIGRAYENLKQMHYSYEEANLVLDRFLSDLPEISTSVFIYQEENAKNSQIYYPLESELQLLNSVRQGMDVDAIRHLDEIERRNFHDYIIDPDKITILFNEIKGTVLRLSNYLELIDDQSRTTIDEYRMKFFPVDNAGGFFTETRVLLTMMANKFKLQTERKDTRVSKTDIETFITEKFNDINLSLTSVSDHFELNESYFSRFFKKLFHVNFSKYLENYRLNFAQRHIVETDLTLKEIVSMTGYASSVTFSRAFKKKFGQNPSAYRDNIRSKAQN